MNIVTQVRIQSQQSIFINFLNTVLTGKFLEVPNKVRKRKTHEAYYVMCLLPTLNNQLELTSLTPFQNGVPQTNVFKVLLASLGFYRL